MLSGVGSTDNRAALTSGRGDRELIGQAACGRANRITDTQGSVQRLSKGGEGGFGSSDDESGKVQSHLASVGGALADASVASSSGALCALEIGHVLGKGAAAIHGD